jgi:Ca2+/H+ antiporter, TMEM165/GDT1 family
VEALLTAFVAALLIEWDGKTQRIAAFLGNHAGRGTAVLAGVTVAAIAGCGLAAWAGTALHDMLTVRAASLLLALSILFAGISGFWSGTSPEVNATSKAGTFAQTTWSSFVHAFGEGTHFAVAALVATFNQPFLTASGAAAGMIAIAAAPVMMGGEFGRVVPVKRIRIMISVLLLLTGCVVAARALRLV